MIDLVRVIGKLYAIRLVEKDKDSVDYGECDSDQCTIDIASFQCEQQKHDTVLHEVLHAIDHEMHCSMSEAQIRRMATGLYAVMRDNPAFMAYLLG